MLLAPPLLLARHLSLSLAVHFPRSVDNLMTVSPDERTREQRIISPLFSDLTEVESESTPPSAKSGCAVSEPLSVVLGNGNALRPQCFFPT